MGCVSHHCGLEKCNLFVGDLWRAEVLDGSTAFVGGFKADGPENRFLVILRKDQGDRSKIKGTGH